MIRRRKNSFQAVLYAGIDPVTGRELYLRGSSTDEREAERMLRAFQVQVAEQRHAKTRASLRTTIDAWLATNELEASTRENYSWLIAKHIDPVLGDEPIAKVTAYIPERFYASCVAARPGATADPSSSTASTGRTIAERSSTSDLPAGRPKAGYPPHDCAEKGCVVIECEPHVCEPLGAATVRKVHFVIRGSLAAAMRLGVDHLQSGRARAYPSPTGVGPRSADAGGGRGSGRSCPHALRWTDVDFDGATLYVRRNMSGSPAGTSRRTPRRTAPDDSRSTRPRSRCCGSTVIATRSDAATPASSHRRAPTSSRTRRRTTGRATRVGSRDRYGRMCARVEIDSHLHALRHYTATELLSAGVDLGTVAGRLGHGGGGATALRVHTAWVEDSDRRAARIVSDRLPRRPGS